MGRPRHKIKLYLTESDIREIFKLWHEDYTENHEDYTPALESTAEELADDTTRQFIKLALNVQR